MEYTPFYNAKLLQVITEEVPTLTYFGDPCLHSPAQTVTDIVAVQDTIELLKKTLLQYRDVTGLGRGIAAPQVGVGQRVFVTFIKNEFQVYINPVIHSYGGEKNRYRELCMSSSIIWADIERPASIVMSWIDENGKQHNEEFNSFQARLLQHEYDHIEGVVCLDKALPGTIGFVNNDPLQETLRSD